MTRKEAIDWLKAISFVSDHHITEALDMAIEALSQPIVAWTFKDDERAAFCPLTEVPGPKWIPCSERLPKEKQEVYVTVYFTEGDTGRAYGYIDGFGKWHLCSTVEGTLNSGYEVLAWMPLPKPYKGGDTE